MDSEEAIEDRLTKDWRHYRAAVDDARNTLLANERCRDADARVRAEYFIQMLQTVSFNFYIAPRRQCPNFYIQQIFMPFEIGWGQPCPDFIYRWAFIDGRGAYRVWGRRGNTTWAEIQVMNGFWGDDTLQHLGNLDLDQYTREDGTFEFWFSSKKLEKENWIEIPEDSRNIVLQSREAWCDWAVENGLQINIEAVQSDFVEPWNFSTGEMSRRINQAARFIQANVRFSINQMKDIYREAGGANFFSVREASEGAKTRGGLMGAVKARMGYDIKPGEALILDLNIPDCRYWSASMADMWYQVTDYTYHQSSLNPCQTRTDPDGRTRIVLALEDPGVANWLDPAGCALGLVNLRILYPEPGFAPDFHVKKVDADDLERLLPDTPRVTPQERRDIVEKRAAALLRYGLRSII